MNFDYCPKCGRNATVQKQNDTNYECSNCHWHYWNNAKALPGQRQPKSAAFYEAPRLPSLILQNTVY